MDPRERLETTIRFREPDQVPVYLQVNPVLLARFARLPLLEYLSNLDKQVKAAVAFKKELPDITFDPESPPYVYVELTSFGCELSCSQDEMPGIRHHPIRSVEQIERLEPLDPHSQGTFPECIKAYKYFHEKMGSKSAFIEGPVEISAELLGYDTFLKMMMQRVPAIHHLLDVVTETLIRWIRAQEETCNGLDRLMIADHSPGFYRKTYFDEYFAPYMRRIVEAIRSRVPLLVYHNENLISHTLEGVALLGFDLFHFGPVIDAGEAKKRIAPRLALMGNLDPYQVLVKGTVEEVMKACRECIRKAAPGGGYVLSSGGGVNAETPLENLHAVVRAASLYGRYPINP